MIHEHDLALLRRILTLTRERVLAWREDGDGWYSAEVGGCRMAFRFRYYEATNQIGADPLAIELTMPGRNAAYFSGTEGYALFLEILAAGVEGWSSYAELPSALRLLEEAVAKARPDRGPS